MLRWMKSERSDHPLDNKDPSGALLEQISGKDPIPALEQICAHLDAIKTADNLKPGRALEIVDLLDRTGRPLQRRLNQELVSEGHRMTKFQHVRLWNSVYNYWTELGDGYRFCLAKYEVGAVGSAALKPFLPRIICRATRACNGQVKWALLRYAQVHPRVWRDLGALYFLAESLQLAQTSVTVYRGASGDSTPERELLRPLMLAMSAPEMLLPIQIEIAERVIAQLAPSFRIAARPAPGIHFMLDLGSDRGPGRLTISPEFSPSTRCFGPVGASAPMEQVTKFIDQNELLPPDLHLGGNFDPAVVRSTVRHLQRHWARTQPERKERRRRHVERVSVVHEFEDVVANVGGLFLESPFVSNDEEWVVDNESEGGFGAFAPQPHGSWLKVGNLIGVRREDGVSWGAGIVRRVSLDEKGNRYVGIQMMASGGAAVTVMPVAPARNTAIHPDGELCVLLPSGGVHTGEATLLMRSKMFSASRNLLMRAYDRQYLLFPLSVVEKTEEFDIGRYRILEQLDG